MIMNYGLEMWGKLNRSIKDIYIFFIKKKAFAFRDFVEFKTERFMYNFKCKIQRLFQSKDFVYNFLRCDI